MRIQEENSPYDKPVLIIKSHVLRWCNDHGYRVSSKMPRALNDAVIEILEKATIRTKLAKMKTITRGHI